MSKIYDSFLFFNELEILDLRMNILNEVVDYFVIVESTITFSGKPKKLYFEENKPRFDKFKDKIIHIIIDDTPTDFSGISLLPNAEYTPIKNTILLHLNEFESWKTLDKPWSIEAFQRESIIRGLINCNDDDIIVLSDADEIPDPIKLSKIREFVDEIFNFNLNMYYYYLNMYMRNYWPGPKVGTWSKLKTLSLNNLRQHKHTTKTIEDGGWHFSFIGDKMKIIEKIEAYSHQEFNNKHIKDNITSNILAGNDIFFRETECFTQVPIDDSYPKYLRDNLEKYKHLIK